MVRMKTEAASAGPTSRIVYDDQDRMLAFAIEKGASEQWNRDAVAIGREVDGQLVAVAVYEHFTDGDCHVHIASDGSRRWCTRELLVRWFAYPFLQLRLRRITGLVPSRNERALKFDLALGFQVEGRMREAFPDGDMIILGMLRRECRFLPRSSR